MWQQLAFVVVLLLPLLGLDWWIKKRRWARRAKCLDHEFLAAYRGSLPNSDDVQILELRRRIARELGLTPERLLAADRLTDLRDRYCLVISGHLALADLLDDLDNGSNESETVAELIKNALGE